MKVEKLNLTYILFLALVSAMGGFLFGYDWVVIGGAKPFYEPYFSITNLPAAQGWALSSALVGCIVGASISGVLADKYGRKIPLVLAAVLFIISAFGTGYSSSFTEFIVYRIVGGVGIGLASTISPMYIAEISPSKYRGQFVALNQLTIVVGILGAQIVNWCIAETVPTQEAEALALASWNVSTGWRWMFWAELAPALLFFILLFFIPESPRFLASNNKKDKALDILFKIGGAAYATKEVNAICQTPQIKTTATEKDDRNFNSRLYPIMLIGIVLAIFQQWCGINIIFNYAQEIFSAAGYSVGDMLFNVVITGGVNLIFTVLAIRKVDSWGRRNLLLFGSIGLAFVYALLGGAYYFEFQGWPILLLVVCAIAIYAISLAPVTWVVISEIFPTRIRGRAMSLATFSLWVASFVLVFTFPLLNEALGAYGTFWAYSIICILGYFFIKNKLPETKGKSLEEIENILLKK